MITEYRFSQGTPITEEEALAEAAALGMHAFAYDVETPADEPLHWHEFETVSWVISGTGAIRDGDGNIIQLQPGCRAETPAGWLHSGLAGPSVRVVLATNLPYREWTHPIDKDPALLPAS